mmetsp:Transcript_26122/g.102478  ORF Transcript_26122/g.102478 Transcript_26122/m.102478 type:complete len:84 (-) Transcript_26122:1403-1654(-)
MCNPLVWTDSRGSTIRSTGHSIGRTEMGGSRPRPTPVLRWRLRAGMRKPAPRASDGRKHGFPYPKLEPEAVEFVSPSSTVLFF